MFFFTSFSSLSLSLSETVTFYLFRERRRKRKNAYTEKIKRFQEIEGHQSIRVLKRGINNMSECVSKSSLLFSLNLNLNDRSDQIFGCMFFGHGLKRNSNICRKRSKREKKEKEKERERGERFEREERFERDLKS